MDGRTHGHARSLPVHARTARRALVAALDRLLDEGITDYSARTRASRRRMAALYAGFVHAEELLAALAHRRAVAPAMAVAELDAVVRHLVFWAEVDGAEDPSPATRAALASARDTLVRVTGDGAGRHHPPLLDCERCGVGGAALPATPRGDALCATCSRRGRRLRAV